MPETIEYVLSRWPDAITALATLAIAALTFVLIREQRNLRREDRRFRKEAARPRLIAFLEMHPDTFQAIDFIIQNAGGGVAQDIAIRSPDAIEELGISNDWKPIGSLSQGRTYKNFLGIALELFNPMRAPFAVEISYRDLQDTCYHDSFELDVAQFKGLTALETPEEQEVKCLKEISKTLKSIERKTNRS